MPHKIVRTGEFKMSNGLVYDRQN